MPRKVPPLSSLTAKITDACPPIPNLEQTMSEKLPMPKNVQAFVDKYGGIGSKEQDAAFWKEFRKAANAYANVQAKRICDLEHALAEEIKHRDKIEDKMRVELGGHPDSELWGEAGLIAATMRCVDALGEVTDQRDKAQKDSTYWMAIADAARKDAIFWQSMAEGRGHTDETLSN